MVQGTLAGRHRSLRRAIVAAASLLVLGVLTGVAGAALADPTDPRANLSAGFIDNPAPGVANLGVELTAHENKPAGFFNPANPGDFGFVNSDLAFEGDHAFIGNFNGFQIYNIANPDSPTLVTTVVCPGGQGEVSVYGNLLFMSAEETRARTDCLSPGLPSGDPRRFRGVRIFDISNIAAPVQVATVQTCRGSHTHTLLKSPHDDANLYVYVNGTGGVRSAIELPGCLGLPAPITTPQTEQGQAQFLIEVIKVPLAAPQNAAVVHKARLMQVGDIINGLQNAPTTPQHPSGTNWSPTPSSDSCHDITVFPAKDIAAGACEGNGILIDISDPEHPTRISAVADPRFAYWHGATFSNDGSKVIFTDEWGGGTAARCRATDDLSWGANAIYDIVNGQFVFKSYVKMPASQTTQENCVSHLPSLIPVPGRDIITQAWYQAGTSVIDFTDSANPKEIGYYDRGPISSAGLVLGGLWSSYYYNGRIFGSEIARGFDVWKLTPTGQLSTNEIAAAAEVQFDRLTPQHQTQFTIEPSFNVVRSYRDQLVRADAVDAKTLAQIDKFVDRAEAFAANGQAAAASAQLHALSRQLREPEFAALQAALEALANE
jgi:hypothetical protein